MLPNAVCLCTGSYPHQLDHLAVLADIFQIPFLVTDPSLYDLSRTFYPFTNTLYLSEAACSLEFLSKNYDLLLISCKNWTFELSILMRELFDKRMRFCFCPHGNSDKGHLNIQGDLLMHQDLSLVYGDHMKDMLQSRGVLQTLQGTVTTGNYRYNYYLKHRAFYDELAKNDVFCRFKKEQTTLLYAPTWKDVENSSSFFTACPLLLEQLPEDYNLLIKLHPNLENDDPARVYQLMGQYEERGNVVFLTHYPLVYPLLEKVDLYIGDFSSVGYDFLVYDKPMLFFNPSHRNPLTDKGLYLFRCGEEIPKTSYSNLYSMIDEALKNKQKHLSKTRQTILNYTFEKDISFETIRNTLSELINTTCPKHYSAS